METASILASEVMIFTKVRTYKVHKEDFKQSTFDELCKELESRKLVEFKGYNGSEFGYISSETKDYVFVKFLDNLLGFLYTENAWEATTAKACDKFQVFDVE